MISPLMLMDALCLHVMHARCACQAEARKVAWIKKSQLDAIHFFDSSDHTIFQANFNTMGMYWGFCQDIFYNSFGEFSGSLILFENDGNLKADLNIAPIHAIHNCSFFDFFKKV
jgi:hypothetical protein